MTTIQSEKDRVVIFDTTLRDGEQCPGATMTHEEKIEVAELLDTMGVDIIEAGFPIASDGDFYAVNEIAKRAKNSVICGLSRAAFNDIDRCAEAIKPAESKRIHTFLSTSPVHIKWKLQKEPHAVLDMVMAQVTRARNHADAGLEAGRRRDLVPGAVQQGDRRSERVRARERHPPGRHAEECADLRDHDARDRGREADLAGDGQALGTPCLRAQARGDGLS